MAALRPGMPVISRPAYATEINLFPSHTRDHRLSSKARTAPNIWHRKLREKTLQKELLKAGTGFEEGVIQCARRKWDADCTTPKPRIRVGEGRREAFGSCCRQSGRAAFWIWDAETGSLTAEIARKAERSVGRSGRSPEMMQRRATKFPHIAIDVSDRARLPFSLEFDAVSQTRHLHWIPGGGPRRAGVARALRAGGRFVAEFGRQGNIGNVVAARLRRLDSSRHFAR